MEQSSTVISDGWVMSGADAITYWIGDRDDLTAAEVIAEAEAVLVDAMFDEIVHELRTDRSLGTAVDFEQNIPVGITDPDCNGRRIAPFPIVQRSVRSPPEANSL